MKYLLTVIVIILSLPALCQYGNMKVLEISSLPVVSGGTEEDGKLLFDGGEVFGLFVNVSKQSKVKLTVSAKGTKEKNQLPYLRFVCEDQSVTYPIRENDFSDYSYNFTLSKGVHFIKAENTVFPNAFSPNRKLYIERVYVSGNSMKYIEKITADILAEALQNTSEKIRDRKFRRGLLITNDQAKDKTFTENSSFDFFVNEEDENFRNPIGEWISGYITDSADDFVKEIENMRENGITPDTLRITYPTLEKEEDLFNILKTLSKLSLCNIPLQVYDLNAKDRKLLLAAETVIKGCGAESVVYSSLPEEEK